jgi:hypothetical protein
MPTITGDILSAGYTAINAEYTWFATDPEYTLEIAVSFSCSTTVAEDDIISQTPEASASTEAYPDFSVVISLGEIYPDCIVPAGRSKLRPGPRITIE